MKLDLIVKGGAVVTGNDIYRADVGGAGCRDVRELSGLTEAYLDRSDRTTAPGRA
jgi:hypothetical protein